MKMKSSVNHTLLSGPSNIMLRCFFCLNSGGPEINSSFSFNELSLRNISRYLHLGHRDARGENNALCDQFDFRGIKQEQEVCSYSSWFICEPCSPIAEEFNDLYHLMEVTRMRLNWCLEQMQDVMEKGGSTPHDKDGGNLRENARAAITDRLKGVAPMPRVALCKSQDVEDRLRFLNDCRSSEPEEFCGNHNNDDFDDNIDSPFGPPEIVSFEDVKIKMETEHDPKKETGLCKSLKRKQRHSKQEKVKRIKISITQKKQTKLPIKCSFCRAQFRQSYATCGKRIKGRGEMLLHWHVIQNHCDQLFPNQKLDSVTDLRFKKILMELLFKDLISEKGDTICSHCNKRFKCHKQGDTKRVKYIAPIKGHYIQYHFEELEEKLKKIQNDPNLEKILSKCNPSGMICKCGVYLQNIPTRTQHNMWHCPLTATATAIEEKQQEEIPAFPRKNFMDTACDGYTESPKTEPSPYLACDYCSFECDNRPGTNAACRDNMKRHLMRRHPEHYFRTEREGISKWKDDHFVRILLEVLFPKLIVRNDIFTSCTVCELKFKGILYKNNLLSSKMHLVTQHKDELRESLKVILEEDDEVLEEKLESGCSKPKKAKEVVESELDEILDNCRRSNIAEKVTKMDVSGSDGLNNAINNAAN